MKNVRTMLLKIIVGCAYHDDVRRRSKDLILELQMHELALQGAAWCFRRVKFCMVAIWV